MEKETINKICFILVISLLINVMFVYDYVNSDTIYDDRIDRVNYILDNYNSVYYFNTEIMNKNYTVEHVINLWQGDYYHTYKYMMSKAALDYVCDGRGDAIFDYLE